MAQAVIHHTRVLRFNGSRLSRRQFVHNNYSHDSVLNRAKTAIRDYNFANDAANAALGDFSVGKFKMRGLSEMMASGREQMVKDRINLVGLSKSVINAIVVDAEGEDWSEVSRSLSGVPELLSRSGQRLTAASKLPHTKMMGESPSGLGASGRSEERNYYDYVSYRQELDISRNVDRMVRWILLDVNNGILPDDWSWAFRSLWQLTEAEESERRLKVAQADQIYLASQVIDASEIATSRFGSDNYSAETRLTLGREPEAVDPSAVVDPTATPAKIGAPTGPDVQRQALNGAQVTSLSNLIAQVALGNIPAATAKAIIMAAYPVEEAQAQAILAPLVGFVPTDPGALGQGGGNSTPGANASDSKDEQMELQSIVLSKERFSTAEQARQWAARSGYSAALVTVTDDAFHLTQRQASEFTDNLTTVALVDGVTAIMGTKR